MHLTRVSDHSCCHITLMNSEVSYIPYHPGIFSAIDSSIEVQKNSCICWKK